MVLQLNYLIHKIIKLQKIVKVKEITAVTNENGFYSLTNVHQGEYFVIFEYDSEKYILTTYLKRNFRTK